MKMRPVTIERGSLAIVLPKPLRAELEQLYRKADEKFNGHITVTIETPRKPRSTGAGSQSRHFNGHVQQIAQFTGMPFEVVKMELKHRAIKRGYPILYKQDGNPQLDLWGRVMGISEADSSTEECAYLIEEAHELAAEFAESGFMLKEE